MAIYVGDTVFIKVTAIDPYSQEPLVDGYTVTVDFFGPGKRPRQTPADRTSPDVPAMTASYQDDDETYRLSVPTSGSPWVAGTWTYRVKVSGGQFVNTEYGTFRLSA